MLISYYSKWLMATIGAVAIVTLLSVVLLTGQLILQPQFPYLTRPEGQQVITSGDFSLVTFKSAEDFKNYLTKAQENYASGIYSGMARTGTIAAPLALEQGVNAGLGELKTDTSLAPLLAADRISETNVQVLGIDEPDIVKTDGRQIYFSPEQRYYVLRETPSFVPDQKIMPRQYQAAVKSIKAWPPAELAELANIEDVNGNLLLVGDKLLVFANDKIVGYDVANPQKPDKKWEIKYQENHQLVSARLYQNQVYLVTRSYVKYDSPCPIKPLLFGEQELIIPCNMVYHPTLITPADVTYTVTSFNPATGQENKAVSFVGSTDTSIVYMSGDNIYITYSYPGDIFEFIYGAVKNTSNLFPRWFLDKLSKLRTYDISLEAKMAEFQKLWQQLENSLSNDERLKLENNFTNQVSSYAESHKRDLEQTGIIKVAAKDLQVTASVSVPGTPLNQFSLDEYQGNLRIATTLGSSWFWGFSNIESVSDVYILDKKLNTLGSVQNLGETERIYSVRFMQDKGYVVTFRQTDPFYVLDLANPRKPILAGELKIPGYSSYLHPLADNIILGVGQESWKVKLSLFNVSDPKNPKEIAKYSLDDSWSEIQSTHHAFLQDPKHTIFFIPGGRGGYVFSYKDDKLEMVKAVSDISARRALYLNDYLYIIGDNEISVFNENDWLKVNELSLTE